MPSAARNRVERILYGTLQTDDLTRLFLSLREKSHVGKSHVGQSVREVGDFIAHADEREKGPITDAARDFFILAKFRVACSIQPLNLSDLPADIANVLAASIRTSDVRRFKQETDKDIRSAKPLLRSLIAKITPGPSGTLSLKAPSQDEASLFNCLTQSVTFKALLDEDILIHDFAEALRMNNLLTAKERYKLLRLKNAVGLFAMCAMHKSTLILDEVGGPSGSDGWAYPRSA
jgi:hypothetical protein